MKRFLIDTNVAVRFLSNDDPVQSPEAYELFERAVEGEFMLIFSPLVIAECCWVLQSKRYGYSKKEIADKLILLISSSGIKMLDLEVTTIALENYGRHNIDFADAYLGALVNKDEYTSVITWNSKDFNRLAVEHYRPEQV